MTIEQITDAVNDWLDIHMPQFKAEHVTSGNRDLINISGLVLDRQGKYIVPWELTLVPGPDADAPYIIELARKAFKHAGFFLQEEEETK